MTAPLPEGWLLVVLVVAGVVLPMLTLATPLLTVLTGVCVSEGEVAAVDMETAWVPETLVETLPRALAVSRLMRTRPPGSLLSTKEPSDGSE